MNLNNIRERMEKNDLFLTICAEYLNKYETLVTKEIIAEITGGDKRLEQSAFAMFLSSAFIDDDVLEAEMQKEYFIPSIKKLSSNEYKNNPYLKNIPISNQKQGKWTLAYQRYASYEGFVRDDFTLLDDYSEICNIGFFDEEFSFPAVFEDGVEWMAIKPNEIETMKEPIKKARGKVITFGLGMGYFAYMASNKSEVESVTIIERDKNVISLFKSHILPYFACSGKIKIIESDAYEYVQKIMPREKYDYAFVDLWRDTSDGTELYIRMKKLEHLIPQTKFEYWIEKSILVMIRKRIFYAILDSIENGQGKLNEKEIEQRLKLDYLKEFVKFI